MAASAWTAYTKGVLALSKASYNLLSDTFVCTLHTSSYTPAANTDATWADVSATELSTAGGYTAGGVALGSVTDAASTATVTWDAADPTWASFTAGPFRYAVLTRRAGGSLVSGDLLFAYSDLTGSGTITGAGGSFTITLSASGLFQLTHSP
jgi:hypothetical protein